MKKATRIFSLILAFSILFAAFGFSASAEGALDGKTIIAFGDSLTQGTLWWVNNGNAVYTDHLKAAFPNSTVINSGQRGDSTYNASLRFKKDVLDKKPDIVIISFGMNDQAWEIKYNCPIISLENYRNYLVDFTTALKNSGAEVIFMTPNPVYEAAYTPNANNNYAYGLMDDYCNEMRKIAAEYDCDLIDINREFNSRTLSALVSSDGIHQTAAGHKLYGELIAAHLNAVYNNVSKATVSIKCVDEKGRVIKTVSQSGTKGAKLTLVAPEISGFTAASDAVPKDVSLTDGAVYEMKYISGVSVLLERAKRISVRDFSESDLASLRSACAEAESLLSAPTVNAAAMAAGGKKLAALLATAGSDETVISTGASYTATAPNRNDTYDDDSVRLTDGVKGGADGGKPEYAGWNAESVDITIDLGSAKATDIYRAYVAGGAWGIGEARKMTVSVSDDGVSFTEVTSSVTVKTIASSTSEKEPWKSYSITAKTDKVRNSRYIRFTVGGCAYNNFIWISEVEAAITRDRITDRVDVYGFNTAIKAGDAYIFTPDMGALTDNNANLRYTHNIVAKWNSAHKAYVITEVYDNNSGSSQPRTLAEGELLIAVHGDTSVENSADNKRESLKAAVGQALVLNNIDIEHKTVGIGANIAFASLYKTGDINGDGKINATDYVLLKRHCLKTFRLTEEQCLRGDINGDGKVNAVDYVLLKRVCLGTYKL